MQLSQKQKTFYQFCAEFLKCRLNFQHFEKKANRFAKGFVFQELWTPETWLKNV